MHQRRAVCARVSRIYRYMHLVMSVHKTDGKTGERTDILTKPIPKEGIEMYKYFRNLILNVSGKEAND